MNLKYLKKIILAFTFVTPYLVGQTAKINVSGHWQSAGKYFYTLTQKGDQITSEGSFGHGDGHFTGSATFIMNWASASFEANVRGGWIYWNNGGIWKPQGRSEVVSATVDLPAGQADGSSDPLCPPAQCGIIRIEHLPASDPWGKELTIESKEFSYYYENSRHSHWEACPSIGDPSTWDCKYYARFDRFSYQLEQDGKGFTVSVRFRNWASRARKGKLTIKYWAYLAR